MAAKLQEIGLERGWGATVGSTLDTMHLLGELLQVRLSKRVQALPRVQHSGLGGWGAIVGSMLDSMYVLSELLQACLC